MNHKCKRNGYVKAKIQIKPQTNNEVMWLFL